MSFHPMALPAGGYLGLLVALTYYGYKRTNDEADFLVAGRDVGGFVGAGTLLASQISASTVIGAIGIHYRFGVGFALVWVGILAGWLVSFRYVAPQLRQFGGMTVPDFIGSRYADDGADGDYARAISAVLIVIAFTVFLTAQYTAGSLIVQELFGISEATGIVLTAAIAIVYTAAGGMRASVLTDLFQAIVMVGGVLVAVPLAIGTVGGVGTLETELRATNPDLLGQALPWPQIGGFMLASALGVVSAPMLIARFYTMRDEETVRTAIRLSLGAQAVIAVAVAVLGVSARVLFPNLETADLAALLLSQELFGPILGTVFILALFSAILSTIDSVLLVSSAGIAHDIYAKLIRSDPPQRRKLWVNRGAVLVVGTIPCLLTFYRGVLGGLVTLITLLNLSIQGAMLAVPILVGLHWKGATTAGGIGAMVTGFVTVIGWHIGAELVGVIPRTLAGLLGDPVVPGVLVSLLTLVVLSRATDGPSKASTNQFFPGEK